MNYIDIRKVSIWSRLILFLLLFTSSLIAQKNNISTIATVNWGKVDQKASKGNGALKEFIGLDSEMFYTYRVKQMKLLPPIITIESYNFNYKKMMSYSVDFKKKRKGETFEGFLYFQNRIYLLTSKEENEQRYLLGEIVNKKTLIPSGKTIRLGKLPPLASLKNDLSVHEKIFYIKERDNKIVVVTNSVIGGYSLKKFSITVYDANLNRLWTKLINVPYKGRNWRILEVDIDEETNVYVLGKRVKIAEEDESSQIELQAYIQKGEVKRTYIVKELCETTYSDGAKEEVCIRPKLSVYNKNNITVTGLLGKEGRKSDKGFFLYRYNPVFADREVSKEVYFEKIGRKENRMYLEKQGSIDNYLLMEVVPQKDESVIIIGEQRKEEDRGKKSEGLSIKNSGLIMVMRISKDGELMWLKYICKHQVGINSTFDSYIFFQKREKLYFVFNDHVQNYSIMDCMNCRKHQFIDDDLEPVMVEMDFDGNMNKYILYDESRNNYGLVELDRRMNVSNENAIILFFKMPKKLPTGKKIEHYLKLDFE